jgi:low affinity Fe/Cu permease
MALHIKLNELIASNKLASNRTISVEDPDAADLELLRAFYSRLAELAKKEQGLKCSHSLDDAGDVHAWKSGKLRKPVAVAQ